MTYIYIVKWWLHVYMPSRVWLFVTIGTVACQAPLSLEFSMQVEWSGVSFPTPGDFPDPEIKPASPTSPALAGKFFTTASLGKPTCLSIHPLIKGLLELVWVLRHLVLGDTLFSIHPVWFHIPEENSLNGAGVWKARLFPEHPGFTKLLCNLPSRLVARPESTFQNVTNPQKGQTDKPSVCQAGLFEIEKVREFKNQQWWPASWGQRVERTSEYSP